MKKQIGRIAFLVGVVGAILMGLLAHFKVFEMGGWATTVLVLAGIVIGVLNITGDEEVVVMVSALVIGAGAGVYSALPYVGGIVEQMALALAKTMIPTGMTVAIGSFIKKAM